MKRALLVLALLGATAQTARADEDPLLLRAQNLDSSGRTLRLEGILTTIAGVGMLATTGVIWLRGDTCTFDLDCDGTKWILLITGLPTTAFGVTMWWLGQNEIDRAAKLRARASVVPWIAPSRGGALAGVTVLAF